MNVSMRLSAYLSIYLSVYMLYNYLFGRLPVYPRISHNGQVQTACQCINGMNASLDLVTGHERAI